MEANALNLKRPDESSVVAVKMLKEGHTDVEMIDLVSEMDMMKVSKIFWFKMTQEFIEGHTRSLLY